MGAIRMSQKQAKDYLKGQASLEFIHVTLMEVTTSGQKDCLGYVLYRQMDKNDYSKVLTKLTTNSSVQHLSPKSRGQVVECILGLGFVAQVKGCKKLEGIMDMVVLLENK
eukprot:1425675-Heterocapsa_arctica.AAC.1